MADGDVTIGKLLLIEYERVKEEQKTRIGFRDNLIYATLASMAGVIAATLNSRGQANLLLLLPPVSVLLGWTYLVNDEKISAAGQYIRTELASQLASLVPEMTPPPFGWESFHRSDSRRQVRKVSQLVIDLLTFCVAPVTALIVFWFNGTASVTLSLVSIGEAAAICVLGGHIVLYADLKRH